MGVVHRMWRYKKIRLRRNDTTQVTQAKTLRTILSLHLLHPPQQLITEAYHFFLNLLNSAYFSPSPLSPQSSGHYQHLPLGLWQQLPTALHAPSPTLPHRFFILELEWSKMQIWASYTSIEMTPWIKPKCLSLMLKILQDITINNQSHFSVPCHTHNCSF